MYIFIEALYSVLYSERQRKLEKLKETEKIQAINILLNNYVHRVFISMYVYKQPRYH